nr:MAG TPA: hypothetical protein [Caudoviricetes sp.]
MTKNRYNYGLIAQQFQRAHFVQILCHVIFYHIVLYFLSFLNSLFKRY